MNKRYFRISYQWPPGYRGCTVKTVAVPDDGRATAELAKVAIDKIYKHLGEDVKVLTYNKLPSNYKPRGNEIG